MHTNTLVKLLLLLLVPGGTLAFMAPPSFTPSSSSSSARTQTHRLQFGIPDFLTPKSSTTTNDEPTTPKQQQEQQKQDKKIGISGVLQLITAGMGAPFLGDFEGVDKETGKFMFSLEANNLVDENGNSKQTQMPYFENGWVDPEDEARAARGFQFPWQTKQE